MFEGSSPDHRLELDLPQEPIHAAFDPLRIGQVLTNLVSNAIKYSPAGGPVRVSLERADGSAVLAVTDRGLGISPEDRAELFQPFRRGASVQDAIPGVGLGLAASRKLVQAHGGTIEVESEPGSGSTFRVILPLA
jgi:signal transduction histidine kinase